MIFDPRDGFNLGMKLTEVMIRAIWPCDAHAPLALSLNSFQFCFDANRHRTIIATAMPDTASRQSAANTIGPLIGYAPHNAINKQT